MGSGRRFEAGRWCLDLMAEHPVSPGRLAHWLTTGGLVPPGTPLPGVDDRWVERFAELRDHIEVLVRAQLAARPPDAASLRRLNVLAAVAAPPAPRAVPGDDGSLVRELAAPPECAALLAALARDAVELLTDPAARARLRQCEGERCHRVYLDVSRGGRRRWCSSELCGNRVRVARHRARAAGSPTPLLVSVEENFENR
ncbi:CGNR zinc finger domain-containing protein [Streptomyces sp. MUM 203J]|uniref:CGNR zinc finger domain-containing protein n=1 Tax=Streptomyces sp. MUM 203J TaxID=2791990 RepID=UPI001F032FC7|nr:CGNR zinc finger domain-containing protein [Streptomyces sp. MUM 203J]MCH0542800.1 CGNR zinc finger domain-containing protein [Streptomyces sp. MUM 203J]